MRKILLSFIIITFLFIAFAFGKATPSYASRNGCTFFSHISIPDTGIKAPGDMYCFYINGSGTHVNYTESSFLVYSFLSAPGWISDWTERIYTLTPGGKVSYLPAEPIHYGNTYFNASWGTNYNFNGPAGGSVCGQLLSHGIVIATACNGI